MFGMAFRQHAVIPHDCLPPWPGRGPSGVQREGRRVQLQPDHVGDARGGEALLG